MSTARGRIVLAAGGTGGHMFPAQAAARELLGRGLEVVLVTDRRGGGFGPELSQVPVHRISAGAMMGSGPLARARSLASLALGFLQAWRLLRRLRPEAVIGFGGYPSVPTVLAGGRLGCRIVLHEQNAVLGRANRLLARRADVLATAFEQVDGVPAAAQERVRLIGNPVRQAVVELGRHPYAVPGRTGRLSLLVIGGSQGARVFNSLVPAAVARLPEELRARLSVVQQTPGGDAEAVAAAYRASGVSAETAAFFEDLPERLRTAQLLICRAGASTIAELANAGRPAILVPYPFAADDHQAANARALAEAGGGWVMTQHSLTAEQLAERLRALLEAPATLARAAQCAQSLARPDAARRLADLACGRDGANGGERPGSAEQAA